MSKLSIAEVQEALARASIVPEQQEKVINHLQDVIQELKDEKEQQNQTPKLKNKFGVIIFDELNEIKTTNLAALVYQIAENEDYNSVPDRIRSAAKEFNQTKKGKKHPINSTTEAFQVIAPKILKQAGLIRKTKEIVPVLKSNNKI